MRFGFAMRSPQIPIARTGGAVWLEKGKFLTQKNILLSARIFPARAMEVPDRKV